MNYEELEAVAEVLKDELSWGYPPYASPSNEEVEAATWQLLDHAGLL